MRTGRRVGPTVRVRVDEWRGGDVRRHEDRVIAEEPLEVRMAWPGAPARRVAVTMRTPGDDFELAAGFLVGEGVAGLNGHIATVGYCTDPVLTSEQTYNVATVTLDSPPRREPARRPVNPTSACGVCGKDSLAAVHEFGGRPVRSDTRVSHALLSELPERLRRHQRLFGSTGAVHAAGLFDREGAALVTREDVGRHNAVDKVVGAVVLGADGRAAPLREPEGRADTMLCTSARAGFEIVQKAVMAGIPVVAAVGAASSMAVDCAREYGVTLVGFVRGERLVVYAGQERVTG